jgi:glycerophosphoryl diester phosphodiesterase
MRRLMLGVVGTAAALAFSASEAGATPYVHAHRGGPLATMNGTQSPVQPEDTLPAFRAAAKRGFVLELDVKLTSDGVPVVIHDATLDRTTDCTGNVVAKSLAQLADCAVDLLGTEGNSLPLDPGDERRTRIPSLVEALKLAKRKDAEVNLEIKNLPTDPDFDPTSGYAQTVVDAIKGSGFPPSRLIVQSFWPANLDVAKADPALANATLSLLTLAASNAGGPAFADAQGYDWVSPGWPVGQAYVSQAHALGLRVVPYTIDDPAAAQTAAQIGVDAVITNDPRMARRAIRGVAPAEPQMPPPPTASDCAEARATTTVPQIDATLRKSNGPRVFAMQFKQEIRHVVSYESFRTKIECTIRDAVKSRRAKGRPDVVAFNEDIGLMTLATGSRGRAARDIFGDPDSAPSCEPQGAPCGTLGALAAARAGYGAESAAYQARFPAMPALGGTFVAGTDTFARGWMQVFSDMARRYDVYILGSNNQAPFRESVDPAEIAAFADPDLPTPESVFVATAPVAYNEVFMWAPERVRKEGPPMLRNVVTQNKKVPVTPIEELIQIEPGPASGPDGVENVRPYRIPGTKAKLSFATSLPAFIYGHDLGDPPPGVDPCSDIAAYYMRCLSKLGANLVMQDEANPGRWAAQSGEGNYQPLEWMRSTWRAAADPDVSFDYNVTPHMVGNLADLAFDGQTAITQRGLAGGSRCTYVGNRRFMPKAPESDPAYLETYAGRKSEFIGIVPWVTPDAPRDELRETSAALAPGSGAELENDYVETSIVADLPFPPRAGRDSCVKPRAANCTTLLRGTPGDDRLRGGKRSERIRGGRGDDRLAGRGGDDCLGGAGGADRLRGGPGDDRLRGGPGRDRLRCGGGDDIAFAQPRDRVAPSCEEIR